MFSLYGSKSKIIKKYPEPVYGTVVEPFAGSARYSLRYWANNVILYESDPKIYTVWKYLQSASRVDILSLPSVPNATVLENIGGFSQLSDGEKWLIGFCCNGGSAQPKNVSGRHNFNSWDKDKIRISNSLYKIRHWKILNETYQKCNIEFPATYFIDPPYQKKGKWYKHNNVDYSFLAEWCKTRVGNVIVCENDGADWLPFEHLAEVPFTHFKTREDLTRKTKEVVWYNEFPLDK